MKHWKLRAPELHVKHSNCGPPSFKSNTLTQLRTFGNSSFSFVCYRRRTGREPQEGEDGGRTRPGGQGENGGGERRRRNRTGRGGRERRGGESPDRGGDRSPERFNGEEGREGTGQAGNRAQRRSQTKTATSGKGPGRPHEHPPTRPGPQAEGRIKEKSGSPEGTSYRRNIGICRPPNLKSKALIHPSPPSFTHLWQASLLFVCYMRKMGRQPRE